MPISTNFPGQVNGLFKPGNHQALINTDRTTDTDHIVPAKSDNVVISHVPPVPLRGQGEITSANDITPVVHHTRQVAETLSFKGQRTATAESMATTSAIDGIQHIPSDFPNIILEYDTRINPNFPMQVNTVLHELFDTGSEGKKLQNSFTDANAKGHEVIIRPSENSHATCLPELSPQDQKKYEKKSEDSNQIRADDLAQKRSRGRKGPGTNAGVYWSPEMSSFDLARQLVHARRIVKGTYSGGENNGNPNDPTTRAAKENRRAIGLEEYSKKSPSENTIRKQRGALVLTSIPCQESVPNINDNTTAAAIRDNKNPYSGLVKVAYFSANHRNEHPNCIAWSTEDIMVQGKDGKIRRFPVDNGKFIGLPAKTTRSLVRVWHRSFPISMTASQIKYSGSLLNMN